MIDSSKWTGIETKKPKYLIGEIGPLLTVDGINFYSPYYGLKVIIVDDPDEIFA